MNLFKNFFQQQEGKISNAFRLGKIMGIPIYLHLSWFVIFALVMVSLSLQFFPRAYPHWDRSLTWTAGVITSILFFASVVFHELAHSWFSLRQGIPVKSITLFIFGGVARISRESPKPLQELAMSSAGPLSSLVIAGVFAGIRWTIGPMNEPILAVSSWLWRINVALAVFNLIPGFPLDGGRVLRSILWKASGNYKSATRWASWVGQGVAYAFIVFGIGLAVITGDWFSGIWLAFIGWFLENAASTSYHQSMLREALRGLTVRDVITRDCVTLPKDLTLKQVAQEHILPTGRSCFLATDGGHLTGIITLRDIKAIPQAQWGNTKLDQAMTPIDKLRTSRLEESAVEVLDRLDEEEINQMPVVENGNIIGIVTRDSLLRYIRTRTELGI
ncbi:MAG: site-2 protease family protein [Chloroflexi bacterium]|nr:site-2 protease family protein [Chloroflexota bacterium]